MSSFVHVSDKNKKMSSFKSNGDIHKKQDGSYYVLSACDQVMTRQWKPEETYYNFTNFK